MALGHCPSRCVTQRSEPECALRAWRLVDARLLGTV